jgi:hypothetical protein
MQPIRSIAHRRTNAGATLTIRPLRGSGAGHHRQSPRAHMTQEARDPGGPDTVVARGDRHGRGRVQMSFLALAALVAALAAAAAMTGAPAPAAAQGQQGLTAPLLALLAAQQAQLTSADGVAGDSFGYSVALSGDTALVGSPHSSLSPVGSEGAVYVFVRSGPGWTQQAKLTAAVHGFNDWFGGAVALSGDTALIGAPWYDSAGKTDRGAVYVFVRSGTSWSQQGGPIMAGDGAANDWFGWSVALSGDTAVIGAPTDDVLYADQGSAYVFVRSGGSWSQQGLKLWAGEGRATDRLGTSVALSGDTALVGAPEFELDGAHRDQGGAWVFVRSGTDWSQQGGPLTASDANAAGSFGSSVALSGETALVGAFSQDAGYVFVRSGTSWSQQAKLTAVGGAPEDLSGSSVALAADTAVLGACPSGGNIEASQGSVCVFTRSAGSWSQQALLTVVDGSLGDRLGVSVALSGASVLAGADRGDVGYALDQGSATVWLLDGQAPVTTAGLAPAANARGWNTSPVTLTLEAADAGSGVGRTYYRFGGGDFRLYDPATRPAVTAQGVTTIDYYSTDLAGNNETASSVTVRIDGGRPVTTAYPAKVRRRAKVNLAYRIRDPLPGSGRAAVTLKIYSIAKHPRLKATIKVKGAVACNVKRSYRWKCTLPAGAYTVKVFATDLAGNRQSKAGSAKLTVR